MTRYQLCFAALGLSPARHSVSGGRAGGRCKPPVVLFAPQNAAAGLNLSGSRFRHRMAKAAIALGEGGGGLAELRVDNGKER